MAKRLTAWLTQAGARYPVPNPQFDAAKAANEAERIRTKGIEDLERQAAGLLRDDFDPKNRWWGSQVYD